MRRDVGGARFDERREIDLPKRRPSRKGNPARRRRNGNNPAIELLDRRGFVNFAPGAPGGVYYDISSSSGIPDAPRILETLHLNASTNRAAQEKRAHHLNCRPSSHDEHPRTLSAKAMDDIGNDLLLFVVAVQRLNQ